MSNFITPKELLACFDEVIILDARGYQDYQKGHIKGSYAVVIHCQIWSVWLIRLSLMALLAIPRSLCMILGSFWRAASGGRCATWVYLMCAYCRAVLNVGLKKVMFLLKILLRYLQNQQFLTMNCKRIWL